MKKSLFLSDEQATLLAKKAFGEKGFWRQCYQPPHSKAYEVGYSTKIGNVLVSGATLLQAFRRLDISDEWINEAVEASRFSGAPKPARQPSQPALI